MKIRAYRQGYNRSPRLNISVSTLVDDAGGDRQILASIIELEDKEHRHEPELLVTLPGKDQAEWVAVDALVKAYALVREVRRNPVKWKEDE